MYFPTFFFIQVTLTLIIKLCKTISIKYNPKQNITIFTSIAHGFFNILTAEIVNDLNNNCHNKPEVAIKDFKSSPLVHVTDNPLDDFSEPDNQTNHFTNPTGINSPPPFHAKRPIRFNKTARLKLFPKRKQSLHHKTKN